MNYFQNHLNEVPWVMLIISITVFFIIAMSKLLYMLERDFKPAIKADSSQEKTKEFDENSKHDESGRLRVPRPDPVGNGAFDMWAEVHGKESARRAFGLYEDDLND